MTTAIATVNPVSADHQPTDHRIVSHQQWLAERKALLEREKELTRLHDQIARERRALPWVRMEKDYVFETPQGPRRLADLFDGRHQLVMQHFMLPPGWEQGCKSCSYMADHTDATLAHLAARDTSFVAFRGRRSPTSSASASAWAGRSPGCPRTAPTSTATSTHLTPAENESGTLDYNFGGKAHAWSCPASASSGRRRGLRLPHLLDLRPRRGGDDAHLQPARPHAQRPRRGRAGLHQGLGAPP